MKFIVFQEIILENKRLEPKKMVLWEDDVQIPIGMILRCNRCRSFFPETRLRRSKNLKTPEARAQGFSKNLACKAVDVIKACWKGIHISRCEKKKPCHVNHEKRVPERLIF